MILILCFLAVTLHNSDQSAKLAPKKPNIVLAVIDTLRADRLPFYGYDRETAPFLSDLSRSSYLFINAYSASSWTPPSTASIFTSVYPFQHGVVNGMLAFQKELKTNPSALINRIPDSLTTIPEKLKNAGYKTFAVTDNLNICEAEGFSRGFDKFANFTYQGAERVNEALMSWTNEIRNADPYFIYLHYNDPHQPAHGRPPLYEKKPEFPEDYKSKYDSEIRYVDEHLEELFIKFDWLDDTIFVLTSDHGEELWETHRFGHGFSLHNSVIHVPLLIRLPTGAARPVSINSIVSNMDILPTLIDYLELDPINESAGQSLMDFLKRKKPDEKPETAFSYLDNKQNQDFQQIFRAVLHGPWKALHVDPNNKALYNLENDPQENQNIYTQHPVLAEKLLKKFMDFEIHCSHYFSEQVKIELDDQQIESLKSLGYIR